MSKKIWNGPAVRQKASKWGIRLQGPSTISLRMAFPFYKERYIAFIHRSEVPGGRLDFWSACHRTRHLRSCRWTHRYVPAPCQKKPCWTMRIRSSSFSKSAMAPCLIPMIRRRPSSKASLISLNPPLSAPWAAFMKEGKVVQEDGWTSLKK